MSQLVENISDTARWVAIFRAEESERPCSCWSPTNMPNRIPNRTRVRRNESLIVASQLTT